MQVSWIKQQSGSATAMALMTMVILASVAAAYLTTTSGGLSRAMGFSYSENLQSKAAAEAGIRYAWMHAIDNAKIITHSDSSKTQSWDSDGLPTGTVPLDNNDPNSSAFTVTATLMTTNLPTNLPSDRYNYYRITSTGIAGNSRATMNAYLVVPINPEDPPLTEMIRNAKYSNNIPWIVDDNKSPNNFKDDKAYAPGSTAFYQAMFGQTVSPSPGFTLNYQIQLTATDPKNPLATGYGIYYLATSQNANGMSAYVLQYDPGLRPYQILVKKVVATANGTSYTEIQDKKDPVTVYTNYDYTGGTGNQSWQKTTTAASWYVSPKKDDPPSKILEIDDPRSTLYDPTYTKDIMTIPLELVRTKLNSLNSWRGGPNYKDITAMEFAKHTLTIDVHPLPFTLPNGTKGQSIVHKIYIDDLEILRFVDRDSTNNYALLKQGYTGLRIWNASATFENGASSGTGALISLDSWDIQKP